MFTSAESMTFGTVYKDFKEHIEYSETSKYAEKYCIRVYVRVIWKWQYSGGVIVFVSLQRYEFFI